MAKFEAEKLREILLDLERTRQKEEFERKVAEALVTGLRIISSTSNREQMFTLLFRYINTLIPFDTSLLLRETQGAHSPEIELLPIFPSMGFVFKKDDKLIKHSAETPICVFNTQGWENYLISENVDEPQGSILILPLSTESGKYWYFMYANQRSFFSLKHVLIAQKVSELLKQAIIKDDYIVKLVQGNKMRALGEMAGGIAHEINNPLSIIKGSLEILSRLLTPAELSRTALILQTMDKTVERMAKIIQSLKVISRGETNKSSLTLVTIDEIIEDALGCCREKFRSAGIEVSIEMDKSLDGVKLSLNRVVLSQVFLNLLTNAFDAIKREQGQWIKIIVQRHENEVHILFLDSGKGIPVALQGKIFQPFFTTKEIGEGTGLGLGICKSIIEDLGGSLVLDNSFSNTCFRVVIPVGHKD